MAKMKSPQAETPTPPTADDAPGLELPSGMGSTEPLAVYLQWMLLGVILLTAAAVRPAGIGLDALAEAFPLWSHVAGVAAVVFWLLAILERSKRDRKVVGISLHALAGMSVLLSLNPGLLEGVPNRDGWLGLLGVALFAVAHLLLFEDWIAGHAGPRLTTFGQTFRDLATARWWFWASKAAIARRAEAMRRIQTLEEKASARKISEDSAAKAQADRKREEERRRAAEASEAAVRAERAAVEERRKADEEKLQAAQEEEKRVLAELRVAEGRWQTADLNRRADAAKLEQTRLRAEQLEADRLCLEAAVAAQSVAASAEELRVEAAQAAELLKQAQEEFERADADILEESASSAQ